MLEGRFARPITAPARIGVGRGIAGDVDDAGARLELVPHRLQHTERSNDVGLEDSAEDFERVLQQFRLGARAERAGVIDDGIESGVSTREHRQCLPMGRCGYIAADGSDVGDDRQLIARGAQPLLVTCSEDEIPSASGESARERESQSAGRSGDERRSLLLPAFHAASSSCSGISGNLQVQVNLKSRPALDKFAACRICWSSARWRSEAEWLLLPFGFTRSGD